MDHLIHNTLDLGGAKYDPQEETYFVFDLTDSVTAYLRQAHYRVKDHWIHNTLELAGAEYDPEKEAYFVFDLTDSVVAYQREAYYRVMTQWIHIHWI